MPRYRAVFETNGPGGYCCFTAADDASAIAETTERFVIYGRLLSLVEEINPWHSRRIV